MPKVMPTRKIVTRDAQYNFKRQCREPGCSAHPSFGYKGDPRPSYCKAHAAMGMQDVISRRCQEATCDKQPSFGNAGESRAVFCKAHAVIGMVCVKARWKGTDTRPRFSDQELAAANTMLHLV